MRSHRAHTLWFAYLVHRISGLGLAIFLPIHFLVLGLALNEPAALEEVLVWAEHPMVKMAETGLVLLLSIHMFGGIRLLALEFLPWSSNQKTFASLAIACAFLIACIYLLRVF